MTKMPQNHKGRIDRTQAYIDANLSGDLSLDALADVAALSRFHFSRFFRANTGEGVAAAVRRARLNRASLLVAATEDSFAKIATSCGFGHVGSFERAFATAFGLTPSQVRKRGAIPTPIIAPKAGDYTMFPTEIRTGEQAVLAALQHKGAYQDIGKTFEKLVKGLMDLNLWHGSGPSHGIYYDDPSEVPVQDLRAHAAQQMAPGVDVPDDFDRIVLSGGKFLVLICKGPYSKLPEAWTYLYGRVIPEGGFEFRDGIPFERYITDAWSTPPEEHVTEIWMPVT